MLAETLDTAALDLAAVDPAALAALAEARLNDGGFDGAIELLRRWVGLDPHAVEAWVALAVGLTTASRPEAALIACDAALRLQPNHPAALCAKARLLQSRGQPSRAGALFRRALAVESGRAEALLGLAGLAIDAGGWERAQRWVTALAKSAPSAFDLDWLKARIALGRGDMAEAERRTAAALTPDTLTPKQRADVLLLRGVALDGLQRPAEAFGAAVAGKALQRRLYAERMGARESEVAKFDRLAAWFDAADPAPWRQAPAASHVENEPAEHVFLLGFPQSGIDLLSGALAAHAKVKMLNDAPTLAAQSRAFLNGPEGLAQLAVLPQAEAAAWRAHYWADVASLGVKPAGRVFVDAGAAGTCALPVIAKLFPNAKLVLAVRDPRDVVLSGLRANLAVTPLTYPFTDIAEAAAGYAAAMRMTAAYRRALPLTMVEARYEALVTPHEMELQAISDFLGLKPAPAAPNLAGRAEGVGRWRAYGAQLEPVIPILRPWIERLDYPAS
jgi:tetratricopeptide (TPR) repeat protein